MRLGLATISLCLFATPLAANSVPPASVRSTSLRVRPTRSLQDLAACMNERFELIQDTGSHATHPSAMAPLPNPQKTPKQKRQSAHGTGPVIPAPTRAPGFHGSAFTEHRSHVVIPDTPLHEPPPRQTDEVEMDESAGNGGRGARDGSGEQDGSSEAIGGPGPPPRSAPSFASPAPHQSQQPRPQQPVMSPWQHFAATGGAMTPSVERPGGEAISPFFTMGAGGPGHAAANAAGFPGFNLKAPPSTAPRSHSPHLGGPFAQLTLDSGSNTPRPPRPAGTPGIGSSSMSDPFLSIPLGTSTATPSAPSTRKSPSPGAPSTAGGEFGNRDALAAALAARRRGSRSGPSGLSKSVNAADAEVTTPGDKPRTTSTVPSGPVASGMQLKLPPRLGHHTSSGANAATSAAAGTSSLVPQPMSPAELAARMHDATSRLLILDLRQPSAYIAGHAARAVSLPIPSTLLKRQAFTLEKLQDMLPPRSAKVIASWRNYSDVVIVDQDSTAAGLGSVIAGMANKFRPADGASGHEAWQGQIWFVKGGMSACRHVREVDLEYGSDDDDDDDGQESSTAAASGDESGGKVNGQDQSGCADSETASSASSSTVASAKTNKMFGGLSRAAFQQGKWAGRLIVGCG